MKTTEHIYNPIFAIPVKDGLLYVHFGKAKKFMIFNTENKSIKSSYIIEAPQHERGKLPLWLAENNITHVITGGIGLKAIRLLEEYGIQVISGIDTGDPNNIIKKYFEEKLEKGINLCDH
jgi:predicted Fe-Mo cluster-binding NifX family protein